MRIFVSEFLCGGGWPDAALPPSLAREGRSMLLAIIEDLASDGAVEVLTTWDARLPPPKWPGHVRATTVACPQEEFSVARELAVEADATWIIAPESGGLLRDRVERLVSRNGRSLNCTPGAIELCADKLQLAAWLAERGIPTPPARIWDSSARSERDRLRIGNETIRWPVVVKPRDGAGSQSTFVIGPPAATAAPSLAWDNFREELARSPWPGELIVQPFIAGRSASIAALVRTPDDFDLLPIGEQRLSRDGRLAYEGGRLPAPDVRDDTIHRLIAAVIEGLPGLAGWVGFDLVLPTGDEDHALLIEINPRLTTSYVGYRRLARGNLARRIALLDESCEPLGFSGEVSFSAAGDVLL